MKILFTGGGTGGHILPLIAIVREIRRIYTKKDLEFYYLGPKDEFSFILLSQEDFVLKNIISGKIRRYFSFENFIDIGLKIPLGFLQSIFFMITKRPDLVFSKGGSGSIAVTSAARLLRIPVFIHESDVVPGLSNQTTAKWAKRIYISFPKTEYFNTESTILVGNPIRKEILEGDKQEAATIFNLTFSKPVFLIMGGSQGAEKINDFILLILNKLLKDFEIIHITGIQNFNSISAESKVVIDENLNRYYHPVGFLDEEKLKHAYRAADIVISRSGSGSIFEIAAIGKPSVLIPLPSAAGNHQSKNAYAFAENGSAMVIEQENLTPNFFLDNIELLFIHPEKLESMKQAAIAFAKPTAARALAREILEFLMLD